MANHRDEKYLALVREMPCSNCGRYPPSQAAHSNLLEHGKGRGIKAHDATAFPLCPECHHELDNGNKLSRAERRAIIFDGIAKTHIELMKQGKLIVCK